MKITKDGNAYCIKKDDFINLQESDVLFIDEKELKEFENKMIRLTPHEFVSWEKTCSRCGIDKSKAKFKLCQFDKGII